MIMNALNGVYPDAYNLQIITQQEFPVKVRDI